MLTASCDAKTRLYKTQKNTFGLPPGPDQSCPGATTGSGGCWCDPGKGKKCHTCYVDKLQRAYPNVAKSLHRNMDELKNSLAVSADSAVELLRREFQRFSDTESKRKSDGPANYRIHWSGDIFSPEYGSALARAISGFPDIGFWVYTRCWNNISEELSKLTNVSLFISLDPCNLASGLAWLKDVRERWKGGDRIRVAYMGNDLPQSLSDFAEASTGKPIFECPVDSGKMKLEGACHKCGFCIRDDRRVLVFKTK